MIAIAPNTVTISRPIAQTGDYEDTLLTDDDGNPLVDDDAQYLEGDTTPTTVVAGLRVAITAPAGSDDVVGGHKEIVDAVMLAPAAPVVEHTDFVTDDDTAEQYRVVWIRRRRGLGLDHQVVGLRAVKGGAAA